MVFSLNYFFVNPLAPAGPVRAVGSFPYGTGLGRGSLMPWHLPAAIQHAQSKAGGLSRLVKYKSPNLVSELEI